MSARGRELPHPERVPRSDLPAWGEVELEPTERMSAIEPLKLRLRQEFLARFKFATSGTGPSLFCPV